MSILNDFIYPWTLPVAQELHVVLTQLHPVDGLLVAQKAGIDVLSISTQQAPIMIWKSILEEAAKSGCTRQLVQVVHDNLNDRSPRKPFLVGILDESPTSISDEPRTADGAPTFIDDDDNVTDHEARLFGDDLLMPVGQLPSFIATLQKLVAVAPAVCRITVAVPGRTQLGTAFRIADDLLLTNWHVMHRKSDQAPAIAVNAEFGYEDDGDGGILAPSVIRCSEATVHSNRDDDWAIIQCSSPLRPEWPIVPLSHAAVPTTSSSAFIIQHPGGDRKRIAIVRNQVSSVKDRTVHYLTDTAGGSSGSPVFDADGNIIALHHAGGRPVRKLGRQPMVKNEGIRISRVVAGLDAVGIPYL